MYGGMLTRLGKDCLCWPWGQTDLCFLNVGSLSRVGVQGSGQTCHPMRVPKSQGCVRFSWGQECHQASHLGLCNKDVRRARMRLPGPTAGELALVGHEAYLSNCCTFSYTEEKYRVNSEKKKQTSNLFCLITQLEWEGSCCLWLNNS